MNGVHTYKSAGDVISGREESDPFGMRAVRGRSEYDIASVPSTKCYDRSVHNMYINYIFQIDKYIYSCYSSIIKLKLARPTP